MGVEPLASSARSRGWPIEILPGWFKKGAVSTGKVGGGPLPKKGPAAGARLTDLNARGAGSDRPVGGAMGKRQDKSPNDQRSEALNPNRAANKAARANRANQLNPDHPAYHSSRNGERLPPNPAPRPLASLPADRQTACPASRLRWTIFGPDGGHFNRFPSDSERC